MDLDKPRALWVPIVKGFGGAAQGRDRVLLSLSLSVLILILEALCSNNINANACNWEPRAEFLNTKHVQLFPARGGKIKSRLFIAAGLNPGFPFKLLCSGK